MINTLPDKKTPVTRKKKLSSRALAYTILTDVVGKNKKDARLLAGFSPDHRVERTAAHRTVQERIEAACDMVGVCVEANAARLGEIAYNRDEASSDSIRAIGEINDMVGWKAPERIEVQHQTNNVLMIIQAAREQGLSVGQLIRQARDVK